MTRRKSTPIEDFIEEGELLDSKKRYVKRRLAEGFVRRAWYVHVDDEKQVADLVKELEAKRGWGQ